VVLTKATRQRSTYKQVIRSPITVYADLMQNSTYFYNVSSDLGRGCRRGRLAEKIVNWKKTSGGGCLFGCFNKSGLKIHRIHIAILDIFGAK
jgi:hypothetical protein